MESWGTQTDVTELEDMLPIHRRNEPQDERETTLSTEFSHVGDRKKPNLNDEAQSNTTVTEELSEEVEVDTSGRDESDHFPRDVYSNYSQDGNYNECTIPAESVSNAVVEVAVPQTGDDDDSAPPSLNEDEVDVSQRAEDSDVSALLSTVNPTKNPDHSQTESIISSASKSEESQRSQKQLAGIDMRIGEYIEVKFPPVVCTIFPQKPIESTKERTPSPVDLCTMKHSEKKKFPKSIPKLPASCTISEDPRDVLRYVPKSTTMQLKLTPAHHVAERSMLSPKPGYPNANFMSPSPPADLTIGKGIDESEKKMSKDKRKRTRSTSEPVIVISPERKSRSSSGFHSSSMIYSLDNTAHGGLSPAKNRRTSLSFQFGGKSKLTSTHAISALQSQMLCSGNVTSENRSAFSTLRSTLSGQPTRNSFSFIRSPQPSNLKTFCLIFSGATKITKTQNDNKIISWNDKMIQRIGNRESASQDDSGIDVTGTPSSCNEDMKLIGASQKPSQNLKCGELEVSEDDNVDLSLEDDDKGQEINLEEENKLLADDFLEKQDDGKENLTINVQVKDSIRHIRSKESSGIPEESKSSADARSAIEKPNEGEIEVTPKEKQIEKLEMIPDSQVQPKKLQKSQSIPAIDKSEKTEDNEVHSSSSSSCSLCYSSDNTPTSSGSSTLPFEKLGSRKESQLEGDSSDDDSLDNAQDFSGDDVQQQELEPNKDIDLQYDANFESGIMAVSKSKEKISKDMSDKDKNMTSPKSREKWVKDYMASIGACRVQAKVTSHTDKPETKEEKLKHKLEEMEGSDNSEKLKKNKIKKNESRAEEKKLLQKCPDDTKSEENVIDCDKMNKPPEGQEQIDDREFEKIFLGNCISCYFFTCMRLIFVEGTVRVCQEE